MGGIVTARELRRLLGKDHKIIMIDKSPVHSFGGSLVWVMLGWRKPGSIQKPLSSLSKFGIDIYYETVTSISPENNLIRTGERSFQYDYLVVALGAEYALSGIPGLAEVSDTFYTIDGAYRLFRSIQAFKGGNIAICVSALPYKCPPAPYEGGLLLESYLSRKGIKEFEITIFTPESSPLAVTGPPVSKMIAGILHDRNIRFTGGMKLSSIEPSKSILHFDNGETHRFDLCITVPPHRPTAVVRNCGLTGNEGWIDVNPRTL